MSSEHISALVAKIVSFNHCWKMAQQRYGNTSAMARMLRDQKSVLQADLLRENFAYLKPDPDAEEEPLFSVRLHQPVVLNGITRIDAEHMPVRLAEELFTEQELKIIMSKGV
uniref:hypothetical protein n=1 Tax=Rheinheimera sp. TaxID=1869214 RepID=UPI0040479FDA